MMQGMHSSGVPKSMLAIFKLVKTLILLQTVYRDALYMCCTSISETKRRSYAHKNQGLGMKGMH